MADEMGDIFAEQLGGEVVPNANSAQEAMVVDLSTPETPTESTEVTTTETPTKKESSETSTTETPTVETPVETQDDNSNNRSLNNESNDQPKKEVRSAESVEKSKTEFLKFVNDQFNTNFDSIDSFSETLSNKKPSFANEQIEKMNTFVNETGRGIADYIRTQTIDYSKMSNEDVMKVNLKQNNPELTMDEVNTLIAAKYRTDKDKHSESDQTLGKIAMKKDVSKARKELIDMQEKYRMPVKNKETSTEDKAMRENWVNNMSSEVSDVESITFDINDSGEQFTFSLTDDHRKGLVDANSNLNGFFDQYVGENGNWNFDKLNTDMFVLNNFQDILRSVANQYKSKGTEQVVKDIKNPSFNNEPRQASGNKKSVIQELDDIINGENEGLRIG
tara:strand:+ start:1326 stop:2495 length:1170 start_codon:yes stop_codon:yes gene_type:complete